MQDERTELLELCYRDHGVFCKTFFPEKFSAPFNSLHHRIFDSINDPESGNLLVLAPRGIGKTSIAQSLAARAILYRDCSFVVYISSSLAVAEMETENLRHDLASSKEIKGIFGDVQTSDIATALDDSWSKKAWAAYGRTLVMPRGSGQQVRGLNFRDKRPDLIIIDDLEDMDEIDNENNRKKQLNWVLGDVMYTRSRFGVGCTVFYIDTLKHEDAIPVHLREHEGWTFLDLAVCDENMRSLAPDFIDDEEVQQELSNHRKTGTLDVFYREMMNVPVAPETASFKPDYLKYYNWAELPEEVRSRIEIVVICDPAKSVTPQSDFSAIVALGMDSVGNAIYVLECFNERVYPDRLYDEMFDMVARHGAKVLGYEVTGLNEFITYPLYNEISRRGLGSGFQVVELKPRGKNKMERIKALIPFYRRGLIYHNSTGCTGLEKQLLSFPRAQYDDLADALAYGVELFETGERFFYPTGEGDLALEQEYEDLVYEPALDRGLWELSSWPG